MPAITKVKPYPTEIKDGGAFEVGDDSEGKPYISPVGVGPTPMPETPRMTSMTGPAPTPSPTPPPAPSTGAVPPAGGTSPVESAAQTALLKLLEPKPAPSLTDPLMQPIADQYKASRQRGAERDRSAIAERMAAQGMGSGGAFDTAVLAPGQAANRDIATFDANLLKTESDQQRQELLAALGLAGGMGDLNLRRELGYGGLDLNRLLGLGDLGVRRDALSQQGSLGRGALGIDLLRTLMQNDQFYSGQGLSAAQFQAMLNQNALQTLLGGF